MATPAGLRLFGYLPPGTYGWEDDPDPLVIRWLDAQGFEHDRYRALLEAIRSGSIPGKATDEFGALSRWEEALGLPVAPVDATEAQRNAHVVAAFRGRVVVHGRDWKAAIDALVGEGNWQFFEHTPTPNVLTIQIPYAADTWTAAQVEQLVERRTPANQRVIMRYGEGFLLDVSRLDFDAL